MKHSYTIAAAAALFVTAKATPQWGPGGPPGWGPANWPSCAGHCAAEIDWDPDVEDWCNNSSNIDTANSCVADSSCSDSERDGIYQYIATLCVNAGVSVTATPQATFSVTSGAPWPTCSSSSDCGPWYWGPWGTNSEWSTWTTKSGWNDGRPWGPAGWGPWGPSGWGPSTGDWRGSDWRSAPWTNWWGRDRCPGSTWTGWTDGPWGTNAPWTTWGDCSATTTATSVVTTTVSGVATTVTNYGIRVAEASAASAVTGSGATATAVSTGAAFPMRTAGAGIAALGAAFVGVAVGF